VSTASCRRCGFVPLEGARYCPHCGLRVAPSSGDTVVDEPPPDETGRVPVRRVRALRFGIGDSRLAGVARAVLTQSRDVAAATVESLRARSGAQRELLSLRRELKRSAAERDRLLLALGCAVYEEDDAATRVMRAKLAELDESIERTEERMQTIVAEAEGRIEQAQVSVQETQLLEPPSQPDIPEPYPPPGETQPPAPPEIPEPYPPPGELDPPAPPEIPEPYPPREPG
jgi:hypothetical protein